MESKTNKGYFVISLDFELHWGLHDSLKIENNEEKFKKARIAVEKMLELFSHYNINATWATVGLLFAENKEELEKIVSTIKKPNYKDLNNCPYKKMSLFLGENEREDKNHYANTLIKKIKNTQGQELASHTFSHYYALEEGQNIKEFESDIKAFLKITKKEKIKISSIVYPKNQIYYTSILRQYGIKNYRGNPNKFYSKNGKLNRIGRIIDTYLPLDKTTYCIDKVKKGELNNIKASRFLRPYSKKFFLIESLKLLRIKKEMEYAAKKGEIYHLWWHPHNFAENLEKNFKMLENILIHYINLKKKYDFKSVSMNQIEKILSD